MYLKSKRQLNAEGLEPRMMLAGDAMTLAESSAASLNSEDGTHAYLNGGANYAGTFDQLDIRNVLQSGKYLTGEPADWSEGDWNGDGQFNQKDIVFALQSGDFLHRSFAAQGATKDTSNVYNFPGPPSSTAVGTSELIRTPNGIKLTVQTSELTAGNAYTVWFVIFNNPDECEDGCNEDDLLFNPDVAGTLAYAMGHVVGDNGDATFSAHLSEGDTSKYPTDFPVEVNPDVGLVDSQSAEIHIVVRDHGPTIPGLVSEQILSFSGGCDINTCADVQFAVHA
jgi:hypothetical protein